MFRSATPKRRGGRIGWRIARRSHVSELERRLGEIGAEQYGVFSLRQARDAGVPVSTIDKRVARGALSRVEPAVFAFAGVPAMWEQAVVALILSVPGLAAASHKTAAYVWGLSSIVPRPVEIVTVRHRRIHRRDPRIHESVDLEERDVVCIDGIPTTTAVRTVVDLGASASYGYVEHAVDTGLRQRLFSIEDVERYIVRVAKSGRNGIGTIRPIVEERRGWHGVTDSDLEDLFRRVVNEAGIRMPEPQFRLFDGPSFVMRADFSYPERQALFELDSEKWHMDPETFRRDREKQNRAHALGWTVYRFTWRQLKDDPGSVIRTLRAVLAQPPVDPDR